VIHHRVDNGREALAETAFNITRTQRRNQTWREILQRLRAISALKVLGELVGERGQRRG
jgi:hypothetical protein